VKSSLNLAALREVNVARANHWHGGTITGWSTMEWCAAMCGEAGEAANIAKKLKRFDDGIKSANNITDRRTAVNMLAKELADTLIYLDLVAAREGIDLCAAVIDAFNRVSERERLYQFSLGNS
jgi:NTP pyrophosphatase (non-canonical NTP hydrolase)